MKHYPSHRAPVRIEGVEFSRERSPLWRWFWQALALQVLSFIAGCAFDQFILR